MQLSEHSTTTRSPPVSMPAPLNDRVQDILLLSKNHYPVASLVEGARRVIAFHNMYRFGTIQDHDVAHCVVHDLMPFVLPTMDVSRVSEMLLSLGVRTVMGDTSSARAGCTRGSSI